jgi:hypothetical protein
MAACDLNLAVRLVQRRVLPFCKLCSLLTTMGFADAII